MTSYATPPIIALFFVIGWIIYKIYKISRKFILKIYTYIKQKHSNYNYYSKE